MLNKKFKLHVFSIQWNSSEEPHYWEENRDQQIENEGRNWEPRKRNWTSFSEWRTAGGKYEKKKNQDTFCILTYLQNVSAPACLVGRMELARSMKPAFKDVTFLTFDPKVVYECIIFKNSFSRNWLIVKAKRKKATVYWKFYQAFFSTKNSIFNWLHEVSPTFS